MMASVILGMAGRLLAVAGRAGAGGSLAWSSAWIVLFGRAPSLTSAFASGRLLPSCLASGAGGPGCAAGVSTDGGRGQRRARSAWRFWAVCRCLQFIDDHLPDFCPAVSGRASEHRRPYFLPDFLLGPRRSPELLNVRWPTLPPLALALRAHPIRAWAGASIPPSLRCGAGRPRIRATGMTWAPAQFLAHNPETHDVRARLMVIDRARRALPDNP